MQRTNIEFERQRHLANWLVKSSPHMAAAAASAAQPPTAAGAIGSTGASTAAVAVIGAGGVAAAAQIAPGNSAVACNGAPSGAHHGPLAMAAATAAVEARKPKLRRFNSHDTSSNMFSVADFENARLARRNEIELKQRLARRQRNSANGSYGLGGGGGGDVVTSATGGGLTASNGHGGYTGFCGGLNGSGDYSTGDSKTSKGSGRREEPLPADVFLERYPLPRVARFLYPSKNSNETLQSSSSHGSSTAASSSSSGGLKASHSTSNGNSNDANTGTTSSSSGSSGNHQQQQLHNNSINTLGFSDEVFLLYRLVRQRDIYHGYNAKLQASQRKKTVLIPQEFPGYFSLLNEKGLPTATQYGSLMQLVRERVYKFASVDNMPAFSESSPSAASNSPSHEGCLPTKNRPQYVKTTARGGQVFRLLAVFEDGKQEHGQNGHSHSQSNSLSNCKPHLASGGGYMGRDKEKGRYAQLLNEQRQVLYVPLSTKGKFYEIEPGIPQLLQKLGDTQRKLNPECVHRLGALVSAAKQLPLMLRYISGPAGTEIPEQLCISHVSKEDVVIGCPIDEQYAHSSTPPSAAQPPLQLRKLYWSSDMQLVKCLLGFVSDQRMLANGYVQSLLKFCQFNCDQFLKLVEVELLQRSERSGSKTREGLKILKPLHLPKLLRREKSSMAAITNTSAHEKEDSIIFLSKTDLEQLEAKEAAAAAAAAAATLNSSNETSTQGTNRITERMKVFQSTKKKWFRKQQQHQQQQQQQEDKSCVAELQMDVQAKRMSMERYTDMSKLLQERFGNVDNETSIATVHADTQSLHSETETTTLTTSIDHSSMPKSLDTLLQKSMSLQDIELLNGQRQQRPDLLSAHNAAGNADAISEAGTELEDVENQTPPPQSFITEKLYNEFHVKTRQYSKSSSSLHQLRHFSLPQKMQLHETERERRSLAQFKAEQQQLAKEPITGRRAAGGVSLLGGLVALSPAALLSPTSLVEDDLPYSNVRDSLVLSSLGSVPASAAPQATVAPIAVDYTKENIYAEICASHTCDTFSGVTQLTQLPQHDEGDDNVDDDDDDGDYASLKYQPNGPQSVSRVEINCTPATSAISYHTVYLGEEPLGERHATAGAQHVTTVELAGEDNIYNTLK
ncbi:uncharacterized protein LOC132798833 [Drosophila nasuta]|uniref:uncharacterized protein LOC132798833 n=1 Tax=Drosophila nasuta TaxID=42062 RepID=UPI00295E6815|nr:uncharacterized protein LOC132798833 [Drosophila nasuta]XP_060666815.1 uncharacterized protein LOC132798833 [Drosophila nasuta]XP_060666822.1 uncharacterized protein LOC132798833 [Drosophila nasuta]XP_060666829.1 uncharacterized protein LOC132798833 [Drosophila nasuta]